VRTGAWKEDTHPIGCRPTRSRRNALANSAARERTRDPLADPYPAQLPGGDLLVDPPDASTLFDLAQRVGGTRTDLLEVQ
jgi:hypothetical protein